MPRALTEFEEQNKLYCSRLADTWRCRSMNVDLFPLLGGRLLNLNGGNPIRLRRIDRDYAEAAVRVAHSNGYCGLFTRGSGDYPAIDQYGHAETAARIAWIGLFHFLFGCSLTPGTRALGAGFTLNEVQAAVPGRPRDIDGKGFHAAALFSGSALGFLGHCTMDLD